MTVIRYLWCHATVTPGGHPGSQTERRAFGRRSPAKVPEAWHVSGWCDWAGGTAFVGWTNAGETCAVYHSDLIRHPDSCPALVLNADYTPLSYYPLSLWPWQTAIKAMFLERVDVVAHYDREVHSPSASLKLPSVIALRQFVRPNEYPAFTRFNLFLRDRFRCVYCGSHRELTFDHVVPRSQGGRTNWENVATACAPCNLKKGGRTPRQAGMQLSGSFRPRELAGDLRIAAENSDNPPIILRRPLQIPDLFARTHSEQ